MEVADEDFGERFFVLDRPFDRLDGLIVSLDVQVVAHRLAARGEAMEDQAPGFAQGERIAFDGVGMVVGLDPQLLFYAGDHLRRQRPQFVELALEPVDLIQNAGCHD